MAFKWFKKREEPQTTERKNNNGVTLGDPTTLSDVLLQTLLNGGDINRQMALTIPAVASNVDFISNCIAAMPVKLYKHKKKEDKDIVEEQYDDSRVRLLNNDLS